MTGVSRGKSLRDEPQAGAFADEHIEDGGDHRGGDRIRDHLVRTLAAGRLTRVRVRTDVRELIAGGVGDRRGTDRCVEPCRTSTP